jgi:lipopolysaccharide export LptBFGC system permease protein LptF
VVKGNREFTLPELNRLVQPDVRGRLGMPSWRYESFVFELHQRVGLAIAPLTFSAFALILAIRRRANRVTVVAAVGLAGAGYLIIRGLGHALSVSESVSPQLGAWMPQIALVLTIVAVGVPRTLIRTRA